ncbi:MAG: 2-C-methyl-D-erythritol 4-phosphate cytidylyltransferase, partial [Clostridia bacterium]|nr:2-C-methyl-D-erythritol 4-phosphate cytidylyltransferase [Clostridia bacterium]
LFAVQTPQAFDADIIKAALTKAVTEGRSYTDDCAAVEALGVKTYLSRGSEDNIKITTPPDLYLAEAIQRNSSLQETPG